MSDGGPLRPESGEDRDVLRAKYLDYCSAQIADLLLFLSADEIYLLAQRAAREDIGAAQGSYVEMVQLATRWLSQRVTLPPFDVWLQDYRKHPRRYEEYFMGFWETETETGAGTG